MLIILLRVIAQLWQSINASVQLPSLAALIEALIEALIAVLKAIITAFVCTINALHPSSDHYLFQPIKVQQNLPANLFQQQC